MIRTFSRLLGKPRCCCSSKRTSNRQHYALLLLQNQELLLSSQQQHHQQSRRSVACCKGRRVLVTRTVPEQGMEMLRSAGISVTQWESEDPIPRDVLMQKVFGQDALFCLLTDSIDRPLLDSAGDQLKVVATMSVGYDHIDVTECTKRNIAVGYTPDVLTHATAELTVALLLTTSRRLMEGASAVKNGEWGTWKSLWLCGPSLENSTVGLFGYGRIGQQVARCLTGFGVGRFLYTEHAAIQPDAVKAENVPFDELLSQSDFIISCCALNDKTRLIFNNQAFNKMKNSAVFINTSRGPVVNQEHLVEALQNGEISAAGLDVTVPEPLAFDHKLLQLPNCIILPHIGSATNEARNAMSHLTAKNIISALNNEPMPAGVAQQYQCQPV